MIKEGEIYFNTESNLTFNIFLEEYPSVPISNEEYDEEVIEGRNGSLITNKGTYKNKVIPFTFTILSDEIEIDFERIYNWLLEVGDNRLIFGREDRCFIVKKVLFGDLKKEFKSIGEFTVSFICEPFTRELDSIINTITSASTLYYSGTAPSETIFRVHGSGNIQLIVNGETMQINNISNYVEIDSKLMQVRNADLTSKDGDTLGDFILLEKGNNTISFTGAVTKIDIEYTTNYK